MSLADAAAVYTHDADWQRWAACRPGYSPLTSLAFVPPVHAHRSDSSHWARDIAPQALTVCDGCQVRLECLAWADSLGINFGVWGGRLLGKGPDDHKRPVGGA